MLTNKNRSTCVPILRDNNITISNIYILYYTVTDNLEYMFHLVGLFGSLILLDTTTLYTVNPKPTK